MKLSNKYRNALHQNILLSILLKFLYAHFTMHMKLGLITLKILIFFPQRNISYSIVFGNCHHLYLVSSPSAIFSKEDIIDPVAFW